MSRFTYAGLRVVCTLALAVVGLASQAGAVGTSPILNIPVADDGVEVSATLQQGCFTCVVSDLDAIVSKDFFSGARIHLPQGAGSYASIHLNLGTSWDARTRVGFMVRMEEGGVDAFDRLIIETTAPDLSVTSHEGPQAYEVQDLGDGRHFLSVRPSARVAQMTLSMSSSTAGALDVEVLHAGLVAESHLPSFLALRSEGARGAGRVSVDCAGCQVDDSAAMTDGDRETYAKAQIPAGTEGWVRATVRYHKPIAAAAWVGFVVASSVDVMAPEVRERMSLTLSNGQARLVRVSGKELRASVEADGLVYLWARAPGAVDRALLQIHQEAGEDVQVAIHGFMGVPTTLPISAFPVDEPVVLAQAGPQIAARVSELALGAAAPNPFRTTTRIAVSSDGGPVRVDAFDTLGRHVAVVHDGLVRGGAVQFDAGALLSGVYVLRATDSVGALAQIAVTISR